MSILIIKSDADSFELTISKWFKMNNCDVISMDLIGKSGFTKRIYYIKTLIQAKKRYKNIDKVIVFDDSCLYFYTSLFFGNCYLWLWNTISLRKIEKLRLFLLNIGRKIYSFDEGDCKKYRFKHNTQFFFCETPSEETDSKYDLYFVGADKDRYQMLDKIYGHLILNSIKPLFQMMPANDKQYQNKSILCEHFVEYEEVLKNINSSKAVLDICKPGQTGMTYRAMEALFYDKKIVTNNIHYKSLPFYNSNNIYVIENDDFKNLAAFLNSPIERYSDDIKDYYLINNWIDRFV